MSSIIWWLRIFLVSAVVLTAVTARYLASQINDETLLDTEEEELDLEEVLTDYYDDLIEEFVTLKKELELEQLKRKELMENAEMELSLEKLNLEEKKLDLEKQRIELETIKFKEHIEKELKMLDYDYMSDAAVMEPDPEAKNSKDPPNVPNEGSLTRTNLTGTIEDPALAKAQRESDLDRDLIRSKELRLSAIRDTILELRGGKHDVNSTVPSTKVLQEMFANNKGLIPNSSTNSYIEKVQSFYPSCDIPKHTDADLWTDSTAMNLLFEVTYPTASSGTAINVLSAKLRLYKISQANVTSTTESTADNEKSLLNQYGVLPGPSALEDDRLLRVSVYWYTRTLRKNRVKRKLMDSHMFNTVGNEWMEFNVRTAVRTWKDFGRNYGLVVTVEDEDGVMLPADKYVHAMNCSKDAVTVKPLPLFLIDKTKEFMIQQLEANHTQSEQGNATQQVNPYLDYPILDVCTVEVPINEADTFISRMNSNTNTGISMMVARNDLVNTTNSTRNTTQTRRIDDSRPALFNTVGLGSPAVGQNRNNLVPILTKSDVVTAPEDIRMKNELLKAQVERTDPPRRRHSRKHVSNFNK